MIVGVLVRNLAEGNRAKLDDDEKAQEETARGEGNVVDLKTTQGRKQDAGHKLHEEGARPEDEVETTVERCKRVAATARGNLHECRAIPCCLPRSRKSPAADSPNSAPQRVFKADSTTFLSRSM